MAGDRLLNQDAKEQRSGNGGDADKRSLGGAASAARSAVGDAYGEAKRKVATAYEGTRESVADAYAAARDKAADAGRRAADGIEESPMAAVVGGLALGAVVAALLPRTEREVKALGPVGGKINDARQGCSARRARRGSRQDRRARPRSRQGHGCARSSTRWSARPSQAHLYL